MNITVAELERIAYRADLEPESVRADYSGRGMYGARCVGFDLDRGSQAMKLGAAIHSTLIEDEAEEMLDRAMQDSMGLGIIVYFPGVTCDEWVEVD